MRLLTIGTAFLLSAVPVTAQIGNPAGMAPGTPESAPGVPAPHQMNTQDRLFTQLVAIGNMAEIDLGKLGGQKTENGAVRDFARMMVQDHTDAGNQLARLAKQGNVALPGEPDAEHKAMRAELEKLSGPQFDLAYMQGQVVEHQKTATLLEWELGAGQDADLQRFAAATLPIVLRHLQMAKDVTAALTAQGASAAAKPHTTSGTAPDRGRSAPK